MPKYYSLCKLVIKSSVDWSRSKFFFKIYSIQLSQIHSSSELTVFPGGTSEFSLHPIHNGPGLSCISPDRIKHKNQMIGIVLTFRQQDELFFLHCVLDIKCCSITFPKHEIQLYVMDNQFQMSLLHHHPVSGSIRHF